MASFLFQLDDFQIIKICSNMNFMSNNVRHELYIVS